MLAKLPVQAYQLKRTLQEMKEGTEVGAELDRSRNQSFAEILFSGPGDYDEKKEEIDEQIEEVIEIQAVIQKFEDNFKYLEQEHAQN